MARGTTPVLLLMFASLAGLLIQAGANNSLPLHAQEEKKSEEKKPAGEFKPIEIKGQLAETDPKDKKLDNPCKIHRVDLVKDKDYVIDLIAKDFDAYLRLEDPDSTEVAVDDDSGGNLNARIAYKPKVSGSFQISATTLNGNVGPYTLRVREAKVAKLVLGKALDIGADGLKIDSKLDNSEDAKSPVAPPNPCKVYSVKMKAKDTYVIDLESNDFDAYLHVLDGELKSLAMDDDGGDNLNSRLSFRPPQEGTFHILATSLNRADGNFTLRVRIQKD